MITVFYANTVYDRYEEWKDFRKEVNPANTPEIYNGAFIHVDKKDRYAGVDVGWYTADGCPYPEDQIDGRMKAWLLLMD